MPDSHLPRCQSLVGIAGAGARAPAQVPHLSWCHSWVWPGARGPVTAGLSYMGCHTWAVTASAGACSCPSHSSDCLCHCLPAPFLSDSPLKLSLLGTSAGRPPVIPLVTQVLYSLGCTVFLVSLLLCLCCSLCCSSHSLVPQVHALARLLHANSDPVGRRTNDHFLQVLQLSMQPPLAGRLGAPC